MWAYKIQTPGNYPEENIQHSQHGESLKSSTLDIVEKYYGDLLILVLIYLLTAIGLTPGGSSTVHIYTQTIHRTTLLKTCRTTQLTINCEECGLCPVFLFPYFEAYI
jgi:hypothetical protein